MSRRRRAGTVLLVSAVAAVAAGAVTVTAHARPAPPRRVQLAATSPTTLAPVVLTPGAPTTFVTIGTDKVLRITDTPGNAALIFIHESQGYLREQPVTVDGIPQEPIYSDMTPGAITITSKDQISISTSTSPDGPVCDYPLRGASGMDSDPEVTHHVICHIESLDIGRFRGDLQSTPYITSTNIDLGDQDDSLTVRADPLPQPDAQAIDTESGIHYVPVEPHLAYLSDLEDWDVYGGTGNDWIDVNVATREAVYSPGPPSGGQVLFDPDKYGADWIEDWNLSAAHIWGGDGNDTLTAGGANDTVYGENGNDTIIDRPQKVQGGLDHFYGGAGNDTIDGRDGPDYIDGGPGNDTLAGGIGKDQIYANDGEADQVACGGGSNTLLYDAGKDTLINC